MTPNRRVELTGDVHLKALLERINTRDKAMRSAIDDIETAISHPDEYEGSQFLKAARDDLTCALGDIPAGENVLLERIQELEEAGALFEEFTLANFGCPECHRLPVVTRDYFWPVLCKFKAVLAKKETP